MKIVMQGSNSIAANATVENVISGQRFERAPWNSIGGIYTTGSALGITAELNVGGNSITPPTPTNAQNRFPVVPDDSLIQGWEAYAGQLIQVRAVNTTAGALTLFWRVELEEAIEV
jgi:hypothetical protein